MFRERATACDDEERERILLSLAELESTPVVDIAFHYLRMPSEADAAFGVKLLQVTGSGAARHLMDSHIEVLNQAWLAFPALRARIKQVAWDKGASGKLRRALGLDRWPTL